MVNRDELIDRLNSYADLLEGWAYLLPLAFGVDDVESVIDRLTDGLEITDADVVLIEDALAAGEVDPDTAALIAELRGTGS